MRPCEGYNYSRGKGRRLLHGARQGVTSRSSLPSWEGVGRRRQESPRLSCPTGESREGAPSLVGVWGFPNTVRAGGWE